MKKELLLAIDVGTGSARAALVTETGKILAFAAKNTIRSFLILGGPSRVRTPGGREWSSVSGVSLPKWHMAPIGSLGSLPVGKCMPQS